MVLARLTAVALSSTVLVAGQDSSWETEIPEEAQNSNSTCRENDGCGGFGMDWGEMIDANTRMPAPPTDDENPYGGIASLVRQTAFCGIPGGS